jgi:hypothetical protein
MLDGYGIVNYRLDIYHYYVSFPKLSLYIRTGEFEYIIN